MCMHLVLYQREYNSVRTCTVHRSSRGMENFVKPSFLELSCAKKKSKKKKKQVITADLENHRLSHVKDPARFFRGWIFDSQRCPYILCCVFALHYERRIRREMASRALHVSLCLIERAHTLTTAKICSTLTPLGERFVKGSRVWNERR